MFRKKISLLFLLATIFISVFACKNETENKDGSFTLIERSSYYIDNYNGLSVYRDNTTRKPLNGYYVVGNKFTKWEEFGVNNGLLEGDYIIFHENGEMFSKTKYSNGKKHGEERFYSLTGKLSKLNHYKNNIKYGKSFAYFDNGQISQESKIEKEEVVESISYNIIGEIESQMFIKDGLKISQQIKAGKIFSESISSTYDNFEAMKFYNEDGSLKLFFRMLDDGQHQYLIELDEDKNEIKRVDLKANPGEVIKYQQFIGGYSEF